MEKTDKEDDPAKDQNLQMTSNKSASERTVVYGKYTAGGAVCQESAIDKVVARVHLSRLNVDGYTEDKTKSQQNMENAKTGIKRKLEEDESHANGEKRGRGRPKKILEEETPVKSEDSTSIIKKRGRPRKMESTQENQLNRKLVSNSLKRRLKRLNGDKNSDIISSGRVRRPNRKFQDFVVSPNVRYFTPSGTDTLMLRKEKPIAAKIRVKPRLSEVGDKSDENVGEDPLSIGDDVVRSFLPVFDEPARLDNVLILKNKNNSGSQSSISNKQFKEKENEKLISNMRVKLYKKIAPKFSVDKSQKSNVKKYPSPKIQKSSVGTEQKSSTSECSSPKLQKSSTVRSPKLPESDDDDDNDEYSPPKLRFRSQSKSSSPSPKKPKLKVYGTKRKIDIQQEKRKQLGTVNNNSLISNKKSKQVETENNTVVKSGLTKVYSKAKTKVNDSNTPLQPKEDVRYVLVDSDKPPPRTRVPKPSDVDFNKLVRSLKSVKLPAPNWKIRIVVSRQQTITEVTFTNKEEYERCVKFSRTFPGYVITFGKTVVKLLGAPSKISSFNDVTILLDIVHNIQLNDPVLEYSTD